MKSHQLKKVSKKKTRVGRGYGSGKGGHTSTRGQKGQLSRSGHKSMVFFEGGNLPFYKRIPKYRGFKPRNKKNYQAVNLDVIEKNFKDGDKVNIEVLRKLGLVKAKADAKILGYGDFSKKITFEGLPVSKSAEKKITKAGGTVK